MDMIQIYTRVFVYCPFENGRKKKQSGMVDHYPVEIYTTSIYSKSRHDGQ